MSLNIGINGFGRIGRMVLRASLERDDINVVAVNDPFIPVDYMVYMLKYDSTQGICGADISTDGTFLIVNGNKMFVNSEREPSKIKWGEQGASYVCECTGIFKEKDSASLHLAGGAKKVFVSAPSKTINMFCVGTNTDELDAKEELFSNASCTTNCLAPIAKVLNDNFGISSGLMTTVHAVTATQPSVDAPSKKDWRAGRAAFSNIIPSSTGAAIAIGKVIPKLNGKLNGMAFRVPVANGSVIDLTAVLEKDTTYDEVCAAMEKAANGPYKGVLGYADKDSRLVSQDIIGDPRTSIFDAPAGLMIGQRLVKVVSWYDNEWGYSTKLLELVSLVAKKSGDIK